MLFVLPLGLVWFAHRTKALSLLVSSTTLLLAALYPYRVGEAYIGLSSPTAFKRSLLQLAPQLLVSALLMAGERWVRAC